MTTGADTGITERQQTVAVGCLMAVAGFFAAAMVGVLLGRWIGSARGCVAGEGLPACDWQWFFFGAGIVGAVTLPFFTLRALRRSRARTRTSERG